MSARGRVSTEREPRDFYPTPRAAFPPALVERIGEGPSGEIWEPCMGDGRLVRWMQEAGYTIGQEFTVSDISVGQSSTHFGLMEFPRRSFNSVNFCNVPGQKFVPMEEWESPYRSSFRIRIR